MLESSQGYLSGSRVMQPLAEQGSSDIRASIYDQRSVSLFVVNIAIQCIMIILRKSSRKHQIT